MTSSHASASTEALCHIQFLNESQSYRKARNALLEEEMALRRQIEHVAALRRALPSGGEIAEDYVFEMAGADGSATRVKLSQLFEPGKDTLAVYSFMFGPERERPCPGCTHLLDCVDRAVRHSRQRMNLVIVAKSPLPRLLAFAEERGWHELRLLSTAGNSYDRDYFGDTSALPDPVRQQQDIPDGEQWDMPMLNVFRRDGGVIRHTWGSELLYVPPEPGQQYRSSDSIDPVWNLFDITPEGRGVFEPKLDYEVGRSRPYGGDMTNASNEAAIRKIIEARAEALRTGDLEAMMVHVADDVTIFDVVDPLQREGKDASRKRLDEWVASYDGPIAWESRDAHVVTDGDVAFSHAFNRVTGKLKTGAEIDMWFRTTLGFRRNDGRWLIVHDHGSVPFDPNSGLASLGLKP